MRKNTIIGLVLALSGVTAVVFGATLYTQNYSYTVGTGLNGKSPIDFGALPPGANGTKIITGALTTGDVNSQVTFAFTNPGNTWDKVFSAVRIEVKTQSATNPLTVACIAWGTASCNPAVADATFKPPGIQTTYDYWINYVTRSSIPTVTLATSWTQ